MAYLVGNCCNQQAKFRENVENKPPSLRMPPLPAVGDEVRTGGDLLLVVPGVVVVWCPHGHDE
jgi:hypothetical protein